MLAIIYVFNFVDRLLVSILIEPIKLEFGVSDTLIGLLSGVAFAIFYTVFGIPIGRLSDRIGRKPVVAAACVAWSVMTMLCGVATSFAMLLLFRIGVAIGEAGGSAPSVAMVSQLYPARLRSRALSVFMMGPAIGAVAGLGLGGWIAELYGWRWAFILIGAPGVALGVLLALTVREPKAPVAPAAQAPDESLADTLNQLLRTPGFGLIMLAASVATVTGMAVGTWNPSFLIRSHSLSLQEAGFLMGVGGGLVSVLGTLTCGVVTDRLNSRDSGWQLGTALLGTILSIPFGLLFFLWPSGLAVHIGSMAVPQAFLFYAGFAFFGVWWTVPIFGSLSHLFPARQLAQATALLFMGNTLLGVGLGPLLVGLLSDYFSPSLGGEALRYALAICIGLLAVSCVSLSVAIPRYRHQVKNYPVQALAPAAAAQPA
ncbi:arabinose ABC transporter permease [Marinobacter sp. X15-166B]|nr:MFS transporter [Marinobacter sp. X15-166B]OEY67958.1 arabinose ABC transporter permease [Marinobacter sp. X15-166B]